MADELGGWLAAAASGLVVIDGDAGVGKSRLASAAADRATSAGREVITVRASLATSTIPFGAFAPILTLLSIDERDEVGVLTALLGHLGAGQALVVDDLPLLDDGSVAALLQIIDIAPVLATARSGQPVPEAFAAAIDDRGGRRMTAGVLDPTAVEHLLRAVLDAPIEPSATQRLAEVSGGNPLFLREVVGAALDSGALHLDHRGWQLDRLDVSARLIDTVSQRLDRLGPSERRLVELLAAAQPLPLGAIADAELEPVEEAGLVASDPTGVRLAHPIYDEVLRASCPPSRWRTRLREGADLLAGHGADEQPDGVLRLVRMRTEAGAPIDPAVLATAARRAHELLDHRLAIDLASASLRAGGARYEAHWARGAAHSCLRANADAEADLRAAVALAVDDEQLARALQRLGLQLAAHQGRTAAALEVISAEAARLTDPAWRAFVDADIAKWELSLGHMPRLDEQSTDPATRLNVCAITALASALDGRFTAAAAAIDEGLPLARRHRDVLAYGEELLLVARFLALSFSGDATAAVALATTQLELDTPRRRDAIGAWQYLLAQLHLSAGRADTALAHAEAAIEHLLWHDMVGLLATAHAAKACALAQLGRTADAARAIEAIDDAARAEVRTAVCIGQAEAWMLVANGRTDDAAASLAAVGQHGLDAAHTALGAVVAHEAVRLGHPELVVGPLVDAADGREGTLLPALAEHADAALVGDADRLDHVSACLEQVGLIADAADAATRAATAHRRRGRAENARRSDRRATGLRSSLGGDPRPVLTARELEVAIAAAGDRLRSREIAERLGLSARTVDNHLNRAYRKLGVVDRVELARALRDLGVLDA
jgi:DNA-binding CsgD family transcriptional regulator